MFKPPAKLRGALFLIRKGGAFNGDALEVLKALPKKIVQCWAASLPYWSLKDYGVPGQIGLEKIPNEYRRKLTEVFHAVRRVMMDDGTLWLNLGGTFYRAGKGCRMKPREIVGIP